jgi:mycothiol synthase
VALQIVRSRQLDAARADEVVQLAARLEHAHGRAPLSDQALSLVRSDSVEHVLALELDALHGYAQRDGEAVEIAAFGNAIEVLIDEFAGTHALIWAHGRDSDVGRELERRGFARKRELRQLRAELATRPELRALPDGIEICSFVVGVDEDDWLRVNARAFVALPDQSGWTRRDIEAREREPWFDPDGLLMAWRGADLAGFHWTKIHPDGAGEVYVLAVDPSAQGTGLGAVLLERGLAHLYDKGCRTVLLYVDASNTGAIALYERNGFALHDADVQWESV